MVNVEDTYWQSSLTRPAFLHRSVQCAECGRHRYGGAGHVAHDVQTDQVPGWGARLPSYSGERQVQDRQVQTSAAHHAGHLQPRHPRQALGRRELSTTVKLMQFGWMNTHGPRSYFFFFFTIFFHNFHHSYYFILFSLFLVFYTNFLIFTILYYFHCS